MSNRHKFGTYYYIIYGYSTIYIRGEGYGEKGNNKRKKIRNLQVVEILKASKMVGEKHRREPEEEITKWKRRMEV